MKSLLFVLFCFATTAVHAETLNCQIQELAQPSNQGSALVALDFTGEESVVDSADIDVGDENYSFTIQAIVEGQTLNVIATFYENNHVQDEVASASWSIDLTQKAFKNPVLSEPLTGDDGQNVLSFTCSLLK